MGSFDAYRQIASALRGSGIRELVEFRFGGRDCNRFVQRVVDRQKTAVGSPGSVRVVEPPKPVRLKFVHDGLTSRADGQQQEESGETLHLSLHLYSISAMMISIGIT